MRCADLFKKTALIVVIGFSSMAFAEDSNITAPYGTAKSSSYADIDQLKQLKVVWDFNFQDPKSVGMVFNNVAALLKATAEYGPHEIDPIKVVIVSHGPEVVLWAKKNYSKYKDIVDRAASFAQQGVRFEVCKNDAAALGFKPEDLDGFVTVIPAGPYALTYWQNKGYAYIAVGATMPTSPFSSFNKEDTNKQ
jgi:intracellular sulfur oxidation DsrE/DsrF family protein